MKKEDSIFPVNKICNCALPQITGNYDCCKSCNNAEFNSQGTSSITKWDGSTILEQLQEFNKLPRTSFFREEIISLKKKVLEDLIENIVDISPQMLIRINTIFDDFLK